MAMLKRMQTSNQKKLKDFMGLMSFSGNQPMLKEAKIAKNYLDEKELRAMGQLVLGYLEFEER